MTTAPPSWGVQYTLSLPSESAARAASAELSGMGHRLTAVRVHDHFCFVPSSFWYSRPSMDPELEGWWQVFSLAVYSGYERMVLEPFLRSERIRVAHVARAHGGFQQGYSEGHAATLEGVFVRDGLVHEQADADVALPSPPPKDPARPPAGPPWTCSEVGEPAAVVQAVVAVAERMYGGAEDVPDAVGWLLDEEFAFGKPYGSTGEFLGDLADAVADQGTCTDVTVEAVPFIIELVCDDSVAPGSRLVLLGDLLRLAASGPAAAVSLADRITALGGVWEESAAEYLTRRAIGSDLPMLLSRWEDESDAARFALAALTALCGTRDQHALSGLAALPAPAGSSRADVMSLVAALLSDEGLVSALNRLSSWLPSVAEKAASPNVDPRTLGQAILPDLVLEDVASGIAGADFESIPPPRRLRPVLRPRTTR
ncbi:hypothetical protein ACIBCM_15405 [Streptomyces sp. NPDC051018]|uniref:hypothetical protein n=1 Tax=Streptomyces sp. NPDC051018 TaxID=3365639 RepID=UPI0037B137B6